jgi:hypothetical protein
MQGSNKSCRLVQAEADAQQRDMCMQSMAAPMMAADDQGDKSFLGLRYYVGIGSRRSVEAEGIRLLTTN